LTDFDENLLSQAVAGAPEALHGLLRAHGSAVRRSITGQIPQRWRSLLTEDDVIQQTYADAIAGIRRFKSPNVAAFVTWLTRLAHGNLRDAVKALEARKRGGHHRRMESERSNSSFRDLLANLTSGGSTPSAHAAKMEDVQMLKRAIQRLPPDYQRVVQMYDMEGADADQVGRVLGRTPGAVYMLRARAHDRLREMLTEGFFGSLA
jgi:RNA polymerase sigma factor (sigma-70 family)